MYNWYQVLVFLITSDFSSANVDKDLALCLAFELSIGS